MTVLLVTMEQPSFLFMTLLSFGVALLSTGANILFIRLCEKDDILAQFERVMAEGHLEICFNTDLREEQERNDLLQMDQIVSPFLLDMLLFCSLAGLLLFTWSGISLISHPPTSPSFPTLLLMACLLPLLDLVFRLTACPLLFFLDLLIRHRLQQDKPTLKMHLVDSFMRLKHLDNVSTFLNTVGQRV